MPAQWLDDGARIAMLCPNAQIVYATPAALGLFGAKDLAELESRLLTGEAPSARRLRHLAASGPIGESMRLERLRLFVGRRPTSLNLRWARITTSEGAIFLLLSARAARQDAIQPTRSAPQAFAETSPQARFLWTLDAEGRFGDADSTLVATVGANAPRRGETLDALRRRIRMDHGDELARALAEKATFSDLSVGWLLASVDRRLRIALSAAPTFDRHREFTGYRGFGVIGEAIDAPNPLSAAPASTPAGKALPEGKATFKPELESASGRLGSTLEPSAPVEDSRSAGTPFAASSPEDAAGKTSPPREDAIVPAPIAPLENGSAAVEVGGGAPALGGPDADSASLACDAAPPRTSPATPAALPEVPPEPLAVTESGDGADLVEASEEESRADAEPAPAINSGFVAAGALAKARAQTGPESGGEADASESVPALAEDAGAGEPGSPFGRMANAAASPSDALAHDISAHIVSDAAPDRPQERGAEIYVLRQANSSAAPHTKVVRIRQGALDSSAPRDSAQDAPGDSVELSKSERDAFREIARALVGRTPASRDQAGEANSANPVADACDLLDQAFGTPSAPPPAPEGWPSASVAVGDEMVRRNASAILNRLPIGVLVARDARAIYLNRTLLDLLGYRDLAHFQAADGLAAIFPLRDPQVISPQDTGALRIVRSDGRSLAAEGHVQAIAWDDGPATLITLRRLPETEPETKPRASERETLIREGVAADLHEILKRATDGVVMLDAAARILSLNESAELLFGYDQKEIAGQSVLMLLAPQGHTDVTGRLESLRRLDKADGSNRPLQVIGRDRNGAALALALTLAPMGPPEAPGYCALLRDLTREPEAEWRVAAARDTARDANASKTDFLAKVSHEIRTPLHAILGIAEVMMEERFGPIGNERYKDYLKDIHASGQYVMSLADDLLDLNKIESGKLELAFTPVDVNSLIRECVSLMQSQAARERIIMRVSLFDRLPSVMVNERSLKQIMLNLISNAVKFNEPGGQVIVSTAVGAAGHAVIRVRDTGAGMSESEVGLALEPFSQVGAAGRKGGAGLGLPLTKALVEANNAEFSIRSRREQGTLIEIAFPKVEAAQ